jgi:hypothetical protein
MAGLLGSMIAGGVNGYAKQRLEDIDEKEKFDYTQALADAQTAKDIMLKQMGFANDKEIQATRRQDGFDLADHQFANQKQGMKDEADLKEYTSKKERERLSNYAPSGQSKQEIADNALANGDVAYSKDVTALIPKKENLMKLGDKAYDQDGNVVIDGTDNSAGSSKKGSSKGSESDSTGLDLKEQQAVTGAIEARPELSTIDKITGKAVINERGVKAKTLGAEIYQYNKNMSFEKTAEVASYASGLPYENQFLTKKTPDGTLIKVRAVSLNGAEYRLDNRVYEADKPKAEKPASKPTTKPVSKNDDTEIDEQIATLKNEARGDKNDTPSNLLEIMALDIDQLKAERKNINDSIGKGVGDKYKLKKILNQINQAINDKSNFKFDSSSQMRNTRPIKSTLN